MALRSALSGLHVCGALASCASLVAAIVHWASGLRCLPPLTDRYGDPLQSAKALGVACDVMTYSSGVSCALHLLLAVTVICCRHRPWCYVQQQVLTLLMCVVAVGSGTLLTVDFILWCDSLQHQVSDFSGCYSAAKKYDTEIKSRNMTAYFGNMEAQQASQWAAVPFTLGAVVLYSIAINTRTTTPPPRHLQNDQHQGNGHQGNGQQGNGQQGNRHRDNSHPDNRYQGNSQQDSRRHDYYPPPSRVQDGRPRTGQYLVVREDESAPLILQEARGAVRYHNRGGATSTRRLPPGGGVDNAGASTSDTEA